MSQRVRRAIKTIISSCKEFSVTLPPYLSIKIIKITFLCLSVCFMSFPLSKQESNRWLDDSFSRQGSHISLSCWQRLDIGVHMLAYARSDWCYNTWPSRLEQFSIQQSHDGETTKDLMNGTIISNTTPHCPDTTQPGTHAHQEGLKDVKRTSHEAYSRRELVHPWTNLQLSLFSSSNYAHAIEAPGGYMPS